METNKTTLPNGLTIMSANLPGFESVFCSFYVNVGSKYEDMSQAGISHFFEHMCFKGTKSRDVRQLLTMVDDQGLDFNAWTSKSRTAYHMKGLKTDLPLIVDVLSDILRNSIFPIDEMEKEKNVVIQEIHRSMDDPTSIAYDNMERIAHGDSNYAHSILGPIENVQNFTQDDLFNWVNAWYVPNNICVVAAGNVNHEQLVDEVSKYWNDDSRSATQVVIEAPFSKGFISDNKAFEQNTIFMGWEFPGTHDEDVVFAKSYFSSAFGERMNSPLFYRIREQLGLVYEVSSFSMKDTEVSKFGVYAGTTSDNIQVFFENLAELIDEFLDTVNERSYKAAQKISLNGMLMVKEQPSSIARMMSSEWFTFGRVLDLDYYVNRIKEADFSEINKVVKPYINDDYVLSIVGPDVGDPRKHFVRKEV